MGSRRGPATVMHQRWSALTFLHWRQDAGEVRRVLVLHCLLSFLFNIGVLAFSINVLAGAAS